MTDRASSTSCVNRLKVLADPTRLAVLEALMDAPQHVGQLSDLLGVEQSLMSHHLKVLRDADLVHAARDGKSVQYRLADDAVSTTTTKAINLGCCQLSFENPKPNEPDPS